MADTVQVVLVEDNDVYRSSLELLLGLQEGIDVEGSVSDGVAALEEVQRIRPDVVLVDLRLPGMDGVELVAALAETAPEVAVICLTAEATEADEVAVGDAGAVALVRKGCPVEELAEAIRQAAGSGS
jgi:DNA-binding NarL/FixJ family response regulator